MRKDLIIILLGSRIKEAMSVQEVLTRYGGIIKTRLGIHDPSCAKCGDSGLIVLELLPATSKIKKLKSDLEALCGVKVKCVSLSDR